MNKLKTLSSLLVGAAFKSDVYVGIGILYMVILRQFIVGSVTTIFLIPFFLVARFYRQLWLLVGFFCVACLAVYDHVWPYHWIRTMPFKYGYLIGIFVTGFIWALFEKIFDNAANNIWHWIRVSWRLKGVD